MKIAAKLDYDRVPFGEPVTVRMLVTFTPEPAARAARRPLNLAVVLDRSGSMAGEKLRCVKEAARTLAGALAAEDTFSLTTFDHTVTPLVAPRPVGDGREAIDAAIAGIDSGGNTDLCGGYQQGGLFARQAASDGVLSRILLLTDGLANHGIIDPDRIAAIVDGFRGDGIGTSTIGVGDRYHEELLGMMAERGGGSTYFLREPGEAAAVFAEELGDLFSIDANDVVVRFAPSAEGLSVEQLNTYASDGPLCWRVGGVFGSQPRSLVLEIGCGALPGAAGSSAALGRLEISYRRPTAEGFEPLSETLPVDLQLAARDQLAGLRPDREVTLQAALLVAARAITQAMALADGGSFEEAAKLLERCAEALDGYRLNDPGLEARLRNLRDRAHQLRTVKSAFYRAGERKQMYTESQYLSKTLAAKLAIMEGRSGRQPAGGKARPRPPASGRESAGRGVYPCYLVDGHILSEIGPDRVIVDTGAVVSFGESGSFGLLGHDHGIATSFMGTTIADIADLVGVRVSVLLGADILARHDVRIDLDRGELEIAEGELPLPAPQIAVESFQGVPIIAAAIDGRQERFFFDTGARISYLHSSLAAGWRPDGTERDLLPGFGWFTVDVGIKTVAVGGREFAARFGTLPALLEASLMLAGVRGILGSVSCEGWEVTLASRRGLISFARSTT